MRRFFYKTTGLFLAAVMAASVLPYGTGDAGRYGIRVLAEDTTIRTGKCGENATWSLNTATGALTISGSGSMDDNYVFDHVKTVEIQEGITRIGARSFYCSELTDLVLPKSLVEIGDNAFWGCESLKKITIPAGVRQIGSLAFEKCLGLEQVSVDEANECFTAQDGNLYNLDKTELILYPAGKKEVSFTVPDSVREIGAYAFDYSQYLEEVIIPEGVDGFGSDIPFLGVKVLKNIEVSDENAAFSTRNGNLYNKAGTLFIKYAPGKKDIYFEVPSDVEAIADMAFQSAVFLTNLTIPASVKKLGYGAFYDCSGLKDITIKNAECDIASKVLNGELPERTFYGYENSTAQDYAGKNALHFEALEEKEVDAISVASLPKKTKFALGDYFNSVGLTIQVAYADGTTAIRSKGFKLEGFDSSTLGTQEIIVTYGGAETSYEIEIVKELEKEYIVEGEIKTVDIVEPGETRYVYFVPEVSGEYEFYSMGGQDTYGGILREDGQEIVWSDDGDNDSNFCAICLMEAGQTYILASKLLDDSKLGSFDVTVRHREEEATTDSEEENTTNPPQKETDGQKEEPSTGVSGGEPTTNRNQEAATKKPGESASKKPSDPTSPGDESVVVPSETGKKDFSKPKKVKLYKPKNVKKKKVKLTWKKVSGVSGYEIMYATNKKFKKGKKSILIQKASAKQKTIKRLSRKSYYFRIRAYKIVDGKKIYGAWSKGKKVKVKK